MNQKKAEIKKSSIEVARRFRGWNDAYYRKVGRFPSSEEVVGRAGAGAMSNGIYRLTLDIVSAESRKINRYPRKFSQYKHPSMATARGTIRITKDAQPIGNPDNDPATTFSLTCFKGGIPFDQNVTEEDVVMAYGSGGYDHVVRNLLEYGAFHAVVIPGPTESTIGRLVIYVSARWPRFARKKAEEYKARVVDIISKTTSEYRVRVSTGLRIKTIEGTQPKR